MQPFVALVALVIVTLAPAPARAQSEPRAITLREAVETALRTSPELDVADLARRAAIARVAAARGAFAPVPFVEGSYSLTNVTTSSTTLDDDGGYSDSSFVFTAGVNGTLPVGTVYALSASTTRRQTDSQVADNPTDAFDHSFNSILQLSVTQPILRNGWGAAHEAVDTAIYTAQSAEASRQALASDLALAVTVAYWQLAVAQEAERVAVESVALAEEQLRATRLRIAAGRLSPLDETSAQATVAARQDQLVAMRQGVLAAEGLLQGTLVTIAGPRAAGPGLPDRVRAADAPQAPEVGEAAEVTEADIRDALEKRPEVRALRARLDSARLVADNRDHNSLPNLSVTGTVGMRGLAGDPNAGRTLPDELDGGLDQSLSNFPSHPFFTVSARLELPVPNSARSQEAVAAELDARARAAELDRASWTVRTQVQHAALALARARDRVRTTQEALRLAEESLAGERRKFEAGVSTTFEVVRVQESLAQARNARFAALASYQIAAATYQHRRGTLVPAER